MKGIKQILKFGLPIFAVSLFTTIFSRMDELFITYFVGVAEVGLYNIADSTIGTILTLLGAFTIIYLPIVSEMWAKKEFSILEKTIKHLIKLLTIMGVPIMLLVIFYSGPVISILFGEKFFNAYLIMIVYAPAVLLAPINKIFTPVLISANETKYIVKISLISFGIDFIGNLLLIPKFGAKGATASSVIGMLILFFLIIYKVKKMIQIKIQIKEHLKVILCSIIFILLFSVLVSNLPFNLLVSLIVSGIISGSVYVLSLFITKTITFQEIENIINLGKKRV